MNFRRTGITTMALVATAVAVTVGIRASDNDGWMANTTDDPTLIANGRALFDRLPQVADAARDAFASACGAPNVDYCASSPTLTPAALIAATGAQLVANGARLEHRDCPDPDPDDIINLCREFYSYRGVQVGITIGLDAPLDQTVPANVIGQVLTTSTPVEAEPAPFRSWQVLKIAPANWGTPPCETKTSRGCLRFQGKLAGPGSPAQARQTLRAALQRAGYRLVADRCTTSPTGSTKCTIAGQRFRAMGGHAGMTVVAAISPRGSTGFTALIGATADNASPSVLEPTAGARSG